MNFWVFMRLLLPSFVVYFFLFFKKGQTFRKISLRNSMFCVILQDNETLIRMYCQFCSNLLYWSILVSMWIQRRHSNFHKWSSCPLIFACPAEIDKTGSNPEASWIHLQTNILAAASRTLQFFSFALQVFPPPKFNLLPDSILLSSQIEICLPMHKDRQSHNSVRSHWWWFGNNKHVDTLDYGISVINN